MPAGPSSDRNLRRPRVADSASTKRLNESVLSSLYRSWLSQNGGLTPFAFYNPFDVCQAIRAAATTIQRATTRRAPDGGVPPSNWAVATDIEQTNVQALGMVELA